MIGSDYSTAVFQDGWRVGRTQLEPLTVGHALLLQRLRNTFASCDLKAMANAGPGDIAEAILVCSRPWREAARLVQRRRGAWLLRWKAIPLGIRLIRDRFTFVLVNYMSHHWSGPAVWVRTESAPAHQSDALSVLIGVLTSQLGLSHNHAMDTPLRRAIWDVNIHLQAQGALEFISGADEELFARAEAMKQEVAGG